MGRIAVDLETHPGLHSWQVRVKVCTLITGLELEKRSHTQSGRGAIVVREHRASLLDGRIRDMRVRSFPDRSITLTDTERNGERQFCRQMLQLLVNRDCPYPQALSAVSRTGKMSNHTVTIGNA